jgi:hypothetical protein
MHSTVDSAHPDISPLPQAPRTIAAVDFGPFLGFHGFRLWISIGDFVDFEDWAVAVSVRAESAVPTAARRKPVCKRVTGQPFPSSLWFRRGLSSRLEPWLTPGCPKKHEVDGSWVSQASAHRYHAAIAACESQVVTPPPRFGASGCPRPQLRRSESPLGKFALKTCQSESGPSQRWENVTGTEFAQSALSIGRPFEPRTGRGPRTEPALSPAVRMTDQLKTRTPRPIVNPASPHESAPA